MEAPLFEFPNGKLRWMGEDFSWFEQEVSPDFCFELPMVIANERSEEQVAKFMAAHPGSKRISKPSLNAVGVLQFTPV